MKFVADVLGKTEGLLRKIKNGIYRKTDPQFAVLEKWYEEDPRGLKRTDFDFLLPDSVVFDLGGYMGEWTSNIFSRYCPRVFVFEPVSAYASIIRFRFAKNEKITVIKAGLSPISSESRITLDEFESRLTSESSNTTGTEKIELIAVSEFLENNNITQVDLMKINIEGAEYDLLEHLFESGLISKVHCILVQFHNFEKDATHRRDALRRKLKSEFREVFNYPFVWECWQRDAK